MTQPGPFRHILCPIDFSEHSRHALSYAALLAARTKSALTVAFVEEPFLASAAGRTTMVRITRAELQRFVNRTIAPYAVNRGGLTIDIQVGAPGPEITRIAKRAGCDLIVIGAHGHSGIDKIIFGSTTQSVLRTAAIPILGIPPSSKVSTPAIRRWPAQCAIVPTDLGRQSSHAAKVAADVAGQLGTKICLVHAVPRGPQARLVAARNRLTRLQGAVGSIAVDSRILVGTPAKQIAAIVADSGSDLVILTRKPARKVFDARMGAISYQVLCSAKTPVLSLPPTDAWLRRGRRAQQPRE